MIDETSNPHEPTSTPQVDEADPPTPSPAGIGQDADHDDPYTDPYWEGNDPPGGGGTNDEPAGRE